MSPMAQKVILLVEDHPTNRELVTDLLENAGYQVLQATTAEEGMALISLHRPDLILMDIQLPGQNGLEATRLLKADPATRAIPVIALTAYAMPGDEERIRDAGCDGYLTKPLRVQSLLESIAASLQEKRLKEGWLIADISLEGDVSLRRGGEQ